MFLFVSKYIKPLEEVDRILPEHVAWLDANYAKEVFVFSGRQVPRVGGIILCNVEERKEAEGIIAGDPFVREGIAAYETIEFTPTKFAKDFAPFVGE